MGPLASRPSVESLGHIVRGLRGILLKYSSVGNNVKLLRDSICPDLDVVKLIWSVMVMMVLLLLLLNCLGLVLIVGHSKRCLSASSSSIICRWLQRARGSLNDFPFGLDIFGRNRGNSFEFP